MNINSLFPIPVGFFSLNRQLNDQEIFFLKNLKARPNISNSTSIDHFVLKDKILTSLREFIEESVEMFFKKTVDPKHLVSLKITQSWVNYTNQGQFHHKHSHPNSIISGVFYVQTNPDDKIFFYKEGYQQIKLPPNNFNEFNSESWWFNVLTGNLILFPSHLTHMVPTVEGSEQRISLSFNTFPVGIVGEEMELTGLTLEN